MCWVSLLIPRGDFVSFRGLLSSLLQLAALLAAAAALWRSLGVRLFLLLLFLHLQHLQQQQHQQQQKGVIRKL